jgi:uncharacterized membrane protein
MTKFKRPILSLPFLFVAQSVFAQESVKVVAETHHGFWDKVELITSTWWLTTCIATSLLGLLVGFFVYKSSVAGGKSGTATGSGCLVAVCVFLIAQVFAVATLVSTVFSVPANSEQDSTTNINITAKPPTATTTTGSSTASTTATTTGTSTATPKSGTGTTGDDF